METEEFKAKYERISKDIQSLRADRCKLCRVMSEEHPINRLKGKLVKVNGYNPMFFDRIEIMSDYDYLPLVTVYGYAPKKDGSISKSIRIHYISIDTIEEEIQEVN